MHPNDKAAVLELLEQVESQSGDWRVALEQAQSLIAGLEEVDTRNIYTVHWEIPGRVGGLCWDYSRSVAETVYAARLMLLSGVEGATVRLYKIDTAETITFSIEGELHAMDDMDNTDSLPEGYEIVKRETVVL